MIQVGSGLSTLQYAWNSSSTTEPTTWTSFTSGTTITKSDCISGTYYLWVKVLDGAGNKAESATGTNKWVSSAFTVGTATISFSVASSGTWTNSSKSVTVTYPASLTANRKAGFGTTLSSAQTACSNSSAATSTTKTVSATSNGYVYATATDSVGNTVYASTQVSKIDKVLPTISLTNPSVGKNTFQLQTTAQDTLSGLSKVECYYDIGTRKNWTGSSTTTYKFVQDGNKWTSNNKGVNSSTAQSSWTINLSESYYYTIKYKVSSETNWDKLTITLDGTTIVNAISGNGSELEYTANLAAGSHTITAKFVKDSSNHTYEDCAYLILDDVFVKGATTTYNGSTTSQTTTKTFTVSTGGTIRAWAKAYDLAGNVKTSYSQASPLTFTTSQYTVSFNANGGSGGPSQQTMYYGQSVNLRPIPTRTGYTFNGWAVTSTASSPNYSASTTTTNMTLDSTKVTLYALWKINSYTVTYDTNHLPNNLYINSTPMLGLNRISNYTRAVVEDDTVFQGKYLQYTINEAGISGSGVFSRFEYTDELKEGETYTWSVIVKCSSSHTMKIGIGDWADLQTVNISNEWQKITKTFSLSTNNSASMQFYVAGESWNVGDVISIASPQLAKTSSNNMTSVQKQYNTTLGTLSTPTRENYTFLGWYTEPVGGTRITSSKTVTGNVTYYAHWQYHKPNIGDYAMYDVPYTDIFNNEQYTSSNGWRILQLQQNASDSNKYDVKIISNGNPAGLYYNVSSIGNFQFDGTNGKWAANSTQRNNYANKFYASSSNDNGNMYAAAGLYYNLEKIIFKGTNASNAGYNYGYFTKINGQTPTSTTTGSIFRTTGTLANKITEIRNVALSDVTGKTDASVAYTDPHNLFNYSNRNTSAYFWLASPLDSNDGSVRFIVENGGITASGDGHASIRPVITLTGVSLVWNDSTQGWNLK